MGIEGLLKRIKETYPEVVLEVPLSDLKGYRVAVDMSIYFYKFIRSNPNTWKKTMVEFLLSLKKSKITPICIFDGPNPPKEKILTQLSRKEQSESAIGKMTRCEEHLKKVKEALYGDEKLTEEDIFSMKQDIGMQRQKSVDWEDLHSILEKLTSAIATYDKQTFPVTDKDKEFARSIIEALGFPCMVADGEAEGLCSFLTHKNCDAVLTEDSDVLVYGAKIMLFNYDFRTSTVKAIVAENLFKKMNVKKSTFVDLAIFLGCDYNKDPETGKPFKIKGLYPEAKKPKPTAYGNDKRWKLFMEGWVSTLEEAEKYFDDMSVVNYERIREIFTTPPDDLIRAPYSIPPNEALLKKLFKTHSININLTNLLEVFSPPDFELI